ncbi:flavin-containing monooxygenase [Aspergillus sclerotioniger CBS 115572]|uniref:Flavin-containing monooxygenase n=1 Tax=Aspergillus sclerotioniger CBS 115572 TaxID=1450535 RepID=A0A317VYN9_9EURO|nr:flavin-containing monooxygenase [Aspergillus sclerotioniger CBS 115572]PWY78038.1 flavin-containing monooxygenase [Aspergillus sclerotioniger CBS 115572]
MANLPQGILPTLPCSLPQCHLREDIDAAAIAKEFTTPLSRLSLDHVTPDAIWRDSVALTGTFRTFYSAATITKAWNDRCLARQAQGFQLTPEAARAVRPAPCLGWIEVPFTFEIEAVPAATCSGFLSLVPDGTGGWKIWLLRTILEEFRDQPSVDELEPGSLTAHQSFSDGASYECVVVGCGQSGLSVAGRLQALGVSYLVVDKAPRVGDSWLQRYESMKLHSPKDAAQLPFGPTFTDEYPELMSRHDLARGYQNWAERYSINIAFSTELTSGSWDEDYRKWTLQLRQQQGEQVTTRSITCSHVVMAVGAGGHEPVRPTYPGEDIYQGDILHTAQYKSPRQWEGKHAVIIGSANSAHDAAADMVGTGMASITMVQRSPTCIIPVEYMPKLSKGTMLADRHQLSNPLAVSRLVSLLSIRAQIAQNPERFDALERAGFKVDRDGEVVAHVNERYGGHYMDVGNCANIAKGLVKVKSNSHPTRFTPTGLLFADDTHFPADVVIFATGYKWNVRDTIGELFGKKVYDQVEDYWGLDKEGEIRGAFKPSPHGHIWFISGTTTHSRYYSRFIALHIKADVLGTPVPVYRDTPRDEIPRVVENGEYTN